MANQEQLDKILKQGVKTWNQWRKSIVISTRPERSQSERSRTLIADLGGADLVSRPERNRSRRSRPERSQPQRSQPERSLSQLCQPQSG